MNRLGLPPEKRIILAWESIDVSRSNRTFIEKMSPHVGKFKIGSTSFYNVDISGGMGGGRPAVGSYVDVAMDIAECGSEVFLDPKLADTRDTVGLAMRSIAELGVWGCTIHSCIPDDSIAAAVANRADALVIGVTILTSFTREECIRKFGAAPETRVLEYARDLARLDVDGLVCSPLELPYIAGENSCDNLIRITPGVRPAGSDLGQQKRVMTPADAIRAGADLLVIGGPIMNDPEPWSAAARIVEEIARADANLSQV